MLNVDEGSFLNFFRFGLTFRDAINISLMLFSANILNQLICGSVELLEEFGCWVQIADVVVFSFSAYLLLS